MVFVRNLQDTIRRQEGYIPNRLHPFLVKDGPHVLAEFALAGGPTAVGCQRLTKNSSPKVVRLPTTLELILWKGSKLFKVF